MLLNYSSHIEAMEPVGEVYHGYMSENNYNNI